MPVLRYSELIALPTYEERFKYLQLNGSVGRQTFGHERWMNQRFYRSAEWKAIRNQVIIRDNGCDLGCLDRPIFGKILIHHMNPIDPSDLKSGNSDILNPDFLISCSLATHNGIHYGDLSTLRDPVERTPNDTAPWKA